MQRRAIIFNFILLFFILAVTTNALDFRHFKLNVLSSMETQFFVEDQQKISCNPCKAYIEITDQSAKAIIKTNDGNQIESEFQLHNPMFGFELFTQQYVSQRQQDKTITEALKRKASFGLQWNFLFYLPLQQIRLTLTIEQNNLIQLPVILGIVILAMCALFPLKKQDVNRMKTQMAYRTNIFSLTLTSFLLSILIYYILCIFGLYIINGQNAIYIFISYFVFMGIMSIFLIHSVSVIKVWGIMLFKKVPQGRIIRGLASIILVLTFLGLPFLFALFEKGQIFLYLATLPIIFQIIHSLVMMDYPYWPYVLFSALCTTSLMFIQSLYPIFHFTQISNFAALRILAVIAIQLLIGYLIIKKNVPFQQVCQLVADQATVGVVTAPNINNVQMNNQAKEIKSVEQLTEQKQ